MSVNGGGEPGLTRRRAASGAAANVGGAVARALLLFSGGLLFARVLGPAAMGEFALAATITGLAQLVLEVGLGSALIQQRTLFDRDVRFVFTVTSLLGLASAAVSLLAAMVITRAVAIPGAVLPASVLAGGLVAQGLSHTALSLIRRNLDFGRLQKAHFIGYLVGLTLIGLPLAYMGHGALAPAAALTGQQVLVAVWALMTTKHSMRPQFTCRRDLARFSVAAVGANASNWGLTNVDTLGVAHIFGSGPLGLYSRAYFLAFTPVSTVMSALQGALFAAASRVNSDSKAGAAAYLSALNISALAMLSPLAVLAAAPEPILRVLYGQVWVDAASTLQILALGMPFLVLGSPATALLWSISRASQDAFVTGCAAIGLAVFFAGGGPRTLAAVAGAVAVAYALRFVSQTALCMRHLRIGTRAVVGAVLPGALVGAAIGLVASLSVRLTPNGTPPIAQLVLLTNASMIAFILILVLGRNVLLLEQSNAFLRLLSPRLSQLGRPGRKKMPSTCSSRPDAPSEKPGSSACSSNPCA